MWRSGLWDVTAGFRSLLQFDIVTKYKHVFNEIKYVSTNCYLPCIIVLTGLCCLRLPATGSHGLLSKSLNFSALAGPVLLAKVETAITLSTSAGTLAFRDWKKKMQAFQAVQSRSLLFWHIMLHHWVFVPVDKEQRLRCSRTGWGLKGRKE
jgi:hypothetical protein